MNSPLFEKMTAAEIAELFSSCAKGSVDLKKGEYLVKPSDPVLYFYLVENGSLSVVRDDYWGNRTVISEVGKGGVFGAAYLFAGKKSYRIAVVAKEDTSVIKFDKDFSGLDTDTFNKINGNIIKLLANKDVSLLTNNEHLSQRTTRKKILSFLNAVGEGKNHVTVPFNRQEMADYLAVDRSALSRELSLLQKEGILTYNKNVFVLKNNGGKK